MMHAFFHGVTTVLAVIGALCVTASVIIGLIAWRQYKSSPPSGWNQ
jgi:hypothetical protein